MLQSRENSKMIDSLRVLKKKGKSCRKMKIRVVTKGTSWSCLGKLSFRRCRGAICLRVFKLCCVHNRCFWFFLTVPAIMHL